MKFILDHITKDYEKTLTALNRIKNTTATFNGKYHTDENYCQILIETDMNEDELDNFLWSQKGIGEYIGLSNKK